MSLFQDRCEQIRARVQALVAQARDLWSVDLSKTAVRFDLRGSTAGQAGLRYGQMFLRFNQQMIMNDAWEHLIQETVPHEVAHLVCFANPKLGRNHDLGWKMVCRKLGGQGTRCHSELVEFARGKTFYYTTSTGYTAAVSEQIHRKIQNGQSRFFRDRSRGVINKTCAWSTERPGVESRAVKPAVTPLQPAKPQIPNLPANGTSKAARVRELIAQARRHGHDQLYVIQWAQEELGMSRALAATYVKNNWFKV